MIRGVHQPHECIGDDCPVCAEDAKDLELAYRRWLRQAKVRGESPTGARAKSVNGGDSSVSDDGLSGKDEIMGAVIPGSSKPEATPASLDENETSCPCGSVIQIHSNRGCAEDAARNKVASPRGHGRS